MAKRALAGFLVALVAGIGACSASEGASPVEEPSRGPSTSEEVAPAERDVAPVARFRFVDTSEGMTVEAATNTQVTTFSCPTRTCTGLCDECAAQACRAAGELSDACQALVTNCNDSCNCGVGDTNCGFPVCALDRMICYVGSDDPTPESDPPAPGDPNPFDFAARPSESNSSSPAPSD